MLQAGGIDKLVEQKADAYRSNPQALQKRYSQNQELMDLLAMQKLKTEKEAAARDMQLKAEQTPSTIAEQYEQQLVGMNKNEMAQQTAGIMGERQKKAQQKQQAMGIPPKKKSHTKTMHKNNLKAKAQQLFPHLTVTLTIADALLIAEHCRRTVQNTGASLSPELGAEQSSTEE